MRKVDKTKYERKMHPDFNVEEIQDVPEAYLEGYDPVVIQFEPVSEIKIEKKDEKCTLPIIKEEEKESVSSHPVIEKKTKASSLLERVCVYVQESINLYLDSWKRKKEIGV